MEKVMDLKSKVQTSDEGMKHLLRQRRRLEEDDKTARAEMKADARTCRRSLREERRHGVDVTGLPIRPQTAEKLTERSAAGSRRSRNDCDLLKALVEDQLKTKRRIIHRLEKEMKTLSSHRVQEEECEEKHEAMEKRRDEAAMRKNVEELQSAISQTRERRQEISVLAEKHRASQREVSSRDQAVEKQQGVQEEMGLQEAEVSRLNEKVRKQQADLQELRETCRHGNTRLDQEVQKTQQLHTQLQLTQRQLQVEAERTERLRGEASSSRLLHAADAERWTRGNLLLQAEIQQLQDQNVHCTQMLGEVEEKLGDAREKIREYEDLQMKRDVEIGLLTRQLEEIRDEAERSRTSSQCHRSAVEIFRQKYTTAMETLRETQVQTRRAEEEAELTGKQLLEAREEACSLRSEMSILETRYEQTERRAALTQLLADDLQVALDLLKTRDTERNLQHQEEMEKLRVRTNRQQKEAEAETAQVKSQLRDALLLLQTTRKEVQELREEMQREEVKENEVTRHKLQQMRHRLQELLIFFTDTDDAELRQEDEETEVQPSDDPDENEDVCRISQLLRTVNKLKSKAGLFLRKAVEQGETQRILVSEAAGERDEAREQLQRLKRNLKETQSENSHLHQEREHLLTNINLWISENKAANEGLARRIQRHCEVLNNVGLEGDVHEKQPNAILSGIDEIRSRFSVGSLQLLTRQLSRMSSENKKNRKLLEKERKRRSHLEVLLGFGVTRVSARLTSPPSLELESVGAIFSEQLAGTREKTSKSALQSC